MQTYTLHGISLPIARPACMVHDLQQSLCRQDLGEAKSAMAELYARMGDIRRKAQASEAMVQVRLIGRPCRGANGHLGSGARAGSYRGVCAFCPAGQPCADMAATVTAFDLSLCTMQLIASWQPPVREDLGLAGSSNTASRAVEQLQQLHQNTSICCPVYG